MMDNGIPAYELGEFLEEISTKVQKLICDAGGLLYSSAAGKNFGQTAGNHYKETAESGLSEAEFIKKTNNYMISPKGISGHITNLYNHHEQTGYL